MRPRIALALFALAVSPNLAQADASSAFREAIIHGQPTQDPRITRTTILLVGDGGELLNCSATLLTPTLVLTAAHCAVKDNSEIPLSPSRLQVIFTTYYDGTSGLDRFPRAAVSALRVHPEYSDSEANEAGNPHDLALLRLSTPAPAGYRPAKVIPRLHSIPLGAPAILAGYGDTAPDQSDDEYLLRSLPMHVEEFNEGSTLITLTGAKGSGVGKGDSGGPAFLVEGDELLLFGVCSSSMHSGSPAYYENITRYRDWIESAAGALGEALRLP